jgi:hypothetical protein
MIIFNQWYGRLGNNIIQLSNIIDIAIMYKHNIIFKSGLKHKFFDLSIIEKYFSKYNNNNKITDINNFFYKHKLPFPKDIFTKNVNERNKILKEAFLIDNVKKLDENDLVIHIRSGDIFSSNPHPNYVPPPLSYYIREINKYNYKKIYIICEDKINPVVNKLLTLYKNSFYEENNLEKDIKIILGATNIIPSIGTFIPALTLLSNNIKFVHVPFNNGFKFINGGIEQNSDLVENSSLVENEHMHKKYYKKMKPWKNTEKQRKYILTYNMAEKNDEEIPLWQKILFITLAFIVFYIILLQALIH